MYGTVRTVIQFSGFSVITVIECCELFFELAKFCCCTRLLDRKKKRDDCGNETDETNCEDTENITPPSNDGTEQVVKKRKNDV